MNNKRAKKPVMEPGTIDQAESILAEYAMVDAKIAEITAMMDQKITRIREEYADQLQDLGDVKDEKFNQLQLFAEKNKSLFEKKRSVDMAHGSIGFRIGTPKLKTLKGFTWASVTNLLKIKLPSYVRTVEEAAKDKLIIDRAVPGVLSQFKDCGIECVQDEAFFIDLKKEEFATA
jgi:phage host-nuclease inhibitor protein Gam